MIKFLRRWKKRLEFVRLNRNDIDVAMLSREDRCDAVGGTLPASLRRWLLSLDLTHARVVELVNFENNSHKWFADMVADREIKSYTYNPYCLDDVASPWKRDDWWSAIAAKAESDPFDIIVPDSAVRGHFDRALSICHSHGVIIINSIGSHDIIANYARDKGCGAIKFYGDFKTGDGSQDVATLIFRHSSIFR